VIKSTQEQAVAAWIDYLNQLRLDELASNLARQDTNIAGALEALDKLKDFVGNPGQILGSELTKHGEIAEHAQVNISNARKIIEGLRGEYTFEGVGRFAPEDYLRDGIQIQSKFYNSANNTLGAIKAHLDKYPDFIKNGGKYQIPKDYFSELKKYAEMSSEEGGKLTKEDGRRFYVAVQKFLAESDVSIDDVESTVVDYADVQQGAIHNTISKEKKSIKKTDKKLRSQFHEESKPTLREGLKVTAYSAGIEGGMSFCLSVSKKLNSGKKLHEFTEQDWKDIGIDTTKGTGKGAVRGASVYTMANFLKTPAPIASALVTAIFGMAAQAQLLRQSKITSEEFIENSEVVCLDAAMSAVASLMGQALIPVPVLGTIVGNAVGIVMHGIAKDHLKQEEALIIGFNESIGKLNDQIDAQNKVFIEQLNQEFSKFESIADLAFDLNVNIAFAGSVALARYVGCPEEKILKDKQDVDKFFLE